jgi:hypothetical protein
MGSVGELDILVDEVMGQGGRVYGTTAIKVRDLEEKDIESLWHLRDGDLKTPTHTVTKIRHAHHALARLVAEGRKFPEIAAITGYSPTYISLMQVDPAFKNLVDYYKTNIQEVFISVHERMASLSMLAAEELQERLTEAPEEFSRRELLEVVEKTADRTGFGPRTTQVNVNLDLADRLQKARSRVDGIQAPSQGPQLTEPPQLLELRPNKDSE